MKAPDKRLTRDEAAAAIKDALKDQPLPFAYDGGWGQILADLVCVDKRRLANMAVEGRKTLLKKVIAD